MATPPRLETEIRAETQTLERLLQSVRRGEVRIPRFQRGLKWKKSDVEKLFDSIYLGYPIGTLLFQEHEAPSERVMLAHLQIDAMASSKALSVVDGQQRITSIAASLTPDESGARDPRFCLYFHARDATFAVKSDAEAPPEPWLSVDLLIDAASLSEAMMEQPWSSDMELRRSVFEAGRRIREYTVPVYTVRTEDEDLIREIFTRTNTAGKNMQWNEVHAALFGHKGEDPSTASEISASVAKIGLGKPDERHLQSTMLAVAGLDPTRTMQSYLASARDDLVTAAPTTARALRSTLLFLEQRAAIPHLRLLPHWTPIAILSRFFALHPEPKERSKELIVRWLWRGALFDRYSADRRTVLRSSVRLIDENEELSVQRLLKTVPTNDWTREWVVPSRFDSRSAASRECLLAMASLQPLDLGTGKRVDASSAIEEHDTKAFVVLVKGFGSRPENRSLHSPMPPHSAEDLAEKSPEALRSHAIDSVARELLQHGDVGAALSHRASLIETAFRLQVRGKAGWNRSDRPSLKLLFADEEER